MVYQHVLDERVVSNSPLSFFFPFQPWWLPFPKKAWGMISTLLNCSVHRTLVYYPMQVCKGVHVGRAKPKRVVLA